MEGGGRMVVMTSIRFTFSHQPPQRRAEEGWRKWACSILSCVWHLCDTQTQKKETQPTAIWRTRILVSYLEDDGMCLLFFFFFFSLRDPLFLTHSPPSPSFTSPMSACHAPCPSKKAHVLHSFLTLSLMPFSRLRVEIRMSSILCSLGLLLLSWESWREDHHVYPATGAALCKCRANQNINRNSVVEKIVMMTSSFPCFAY